MGKRDYVPVLIVAAVALISIMPIAVELIEQPARTGLGKAVQISEEICRKETKRCGLGGSIEECQEFDANGCCRRYIISKYCDPREPYCIQEKDSAYCSAVEKEDEEYEEETKIVDAKFRDWVCDEWSECIGYVQSRNCFKGNEQADEQFKPPVKRTCTPPPSCDDRIRNQGEEKVDCGGPCKECPPEPTCHDGAQNQGEEDIDCGGPCPACVSCYDGIQNQGEDDVDCGGPCPTCPEQEIPAQRKTSPSMAWLVTVGVAGLILIGGGLGLVLHERRKSMKEMREEKRAPGDDRIIQLTEYVIREYDYGRKPEIIFTQLHKEGWPTNILKKVLASAKRELAKRPRKPAQKSNQAQGIFMRKKL